MPKDVTWLPSKGILSYEEMLRLVRIAVTLGVEKVRITGGEPLLRRNLPVLVRGLAGIPELRSVNLTTNGFYLEAQAGALYAAGLRSLNVSLDTLDPETFRGMARAEGSPERILAGLEAAARAGFRKIKLNTVLMRGLNEREIPAFARLARARGWEIRFIEFMPLDGDRAWRRDKVVTAAEIRAALETVLPLVPLGGNPHDPARTYTFSDGVGQVGIIASVTEPFCSRCDRIRITADGKIRTCLFATSEMDLKGAMRDGASDGDLAGILVAAVRGKGPGHLVNSRDYVQPERVMNAIGG
jgi:cyclic pyranopterin phosphate synthase